MLFTQKQGESLFLFFCFFFTALISHVKVLLYMPKTLCWHEGWEINKDKGEGRGSHGPMLQGEDERGESGTTLASSRESGPSYPSGQHGTHSAQILCSYGGSGLEDRFLCMVCTKNGTEVSITDVPLPIRA